MCNISLCSHCLFERYSNGSTGSFTVDVAVEGDGSGAVATLTFASGSLSSVAFKDTSSYGSGYKGHLSQH